MIYGSLKVLAIKMIHLRKLIPSIDVNDGKEDSPEESWSKGGTRLSDVLQAGGGPASSDKPNRLSRCRYSQDYEVVPVVLLYRDELMISNVLRRTLPYRGCRLAPVDG